MTAVHAFAIQKVDSARVRTRWTLELVHLLDVQYQSNNIIHVSTDLYNDDETDDDMPTLIDTWDSDSGYGSA
ncbi:hypothetical protein C8J56DRAFT_1060495 [Mycena floridula]|nr:hypothetical protein C8J56DRAFT_1060495 [Mycena floridula]